LNTGEAVVRSDTTMVSVRRYRPSDYRPAARLFRELSRTHRDFYLMKRGPDPDPDRWFHRHLKKHGPKNLYVAEERGRVVGIVGLIPHRNFGEVEPLVVASARRRRGIAGTLIQTVTQEAKRRRWKTLVVEVVARNPVALRTFHALGFRTLVNLDLQMGLNGPGWFVPRPGPRIASRRFQS